MPYDASRGWVRRYRFEKLLRTGKLEGYKSGLYPNKTTAVDALDTWQQQFRTVPGEKLRLTCAASREVREWVFKDGEWVVEKDTFERAAVAKLT